MILTAVIALGALGLIFGLGLAFASVKLAVDGDPNLKKVLEALPGLNCGACGKAGCSAFGEALLKHQAPVNACLPGGEAVAKNLSSILGIEADSAQVKRAVIHCGTTFANRTKVAEYQGIKSCSGAVLVQGAGFACAFSCLGFGDCQRECPFDAITLVNGLPEVDYEKCTGCGLCAKVCPRHIITIDTVKENTDFVAVACRSLHRGPAVKKICEVGCIGCTLCAKKVPEVFEVEQNLAKIYYEKADENTKWDEAVTICPQNTVVKKLTKEQVNSLINK